MCLADSVDTLVLNIAETQPTHLSSVPRFYEKVLALVSGPNIEESRRRQEPILVFVPLEELSWLTQMAPAQTDVIGNNGRYAVVAVNYQYGKPF